MKMTNGWNKFIYRLWAPVYDSTVDRAFQPARRRAMGLLNLQPGERVLLVGVGTGADLPLLPAGVRALGIDLSASMLAKARRKLPLPGREVTLLQGDALQLLPAQSGFDAAILNLILSVIPNGGACLQATLHALKPGGRAFIFDKFLPDGSQLTLTRRATNAFSTMFGTDITRRFADLSRGCDCRVVSNEPSIGAGLYRVILLCKNA